MQFEVNSTILKINQKKQLLFITNSEPDISLWNRSSWMGEGGTRGLETLQSGFQLILIKFVFGTSFILWMIFVDYKVIFSLFLENF